MSSDLRNRLINPPVRIEKVNLDESTEVFLRPIKESDFSILESELFDPITGKTIPEKFDAQRRRLLALTICDAHGTLLFGSSESSLLGTMDSDEAMFLHDEYKRLFPRAKRKSIKSLVKNSEPVPASE